MYELIKITENDYYIDCPAKIGLVKIGGGEAVLIDSGSDKDAGKKAYRVLEAEGLKLRAIYNTHSHADHIGGNKFLKEKTGCTIYAPGLECAYTNNTILEPTGLYGGLPFKELKHKFLMAQESEALPLTEADLPEGFELIRLPGHSFDMVGFKTPDGTAYIADSVSSEETLKKYGIGYLWDAGESLRTLEHIKTIDAKMFVPAHADAAEDITALADFNIKALENVIELILRLLSTPMSFEKLLKCVFDEYALNMTAQQYVLIGSTVRSYLSYLYTEGKTAYEFSENEMLWHTV